MNEESEGIFSCKGMCWITGALLGFAAYLVLRGRWEMSFIVALIVGLAVLVAVAMLLRAVFCREVEETAGGFAAMAAQRSEERKKFEADRAEARAEAAAGKAAKAEADAEAAEEATKAEAEAKAAEEAAAAAKAEADAEAEAEAAKAAAAEAAAKAEADAEAAQAAKPAAKSAKSASGTTKPERKPVAPDGKPEMLSGPREGGADDLKMIKGIGPKLEQLLNSLGVYHFDQIAGWRKKEVEWMDDNLKGFKGRVSRDEWVKQAKVLAKGGTTDFASKVKKGGVY